MIASHDSSDSRQYSWFFTSYQLTATLIPNAPAIYRKFRLMLASLFAQMHGACIAARYARDCPLRRFHYIFIISDIEASHRDAISRAASAIDKWLVALTVYHNVCFSPLSSYRRNAWDTFLYYGTCLISPPLRLHCIYASLLSLSFQYWRSILPISFRNQYRWPFVPAQLEIRARLYVIS